MFYQFLSKIPRKVKHKIRLKNIFFTNYFLFEVKMSNIVTTNIELSW